MTPRLEKACNILRWAIENKKSLVEAQMFLKQTISI